MCWQQRKPGGIYTTIVLVAFLCAPGFVWAADFTARQVTEAFYKAKQGTQFCRCELSAVDFSGADLSGVNLMDADMDGDMDGAILHGVRGLETINGGIRSRISTGLCDSGGKARNGAITGI